MNDSELIPPAGSRSDVQMLADMFNREYAKACHTSQPEDWFQAALTARQMVGEMAKAKIVTDNFPEVHDEIFSENTELMREGAKANGGSRSRLSTGCATQLTKTI